MPGGDGTGPMGLGYGSGRVFWGRNLFGRGQGWRSWCGNPKRVCRPFVYDISMEPKDELEFFKQEAAALKQQLNEVESRIKELEEQD